MTAARAEFGVALVGRRAVAGAVAHRFGRQDGVDRRVRAFQRRGKPRHFRRDVVDALAQQRVFHPLGRPGFLGLALHAGELAGKPVALVDGATELGLQLGLFRLELLVGRTGAAVDLGDGGAQIAFGLARRLRFRRATA